MKRAFAVLAVLALAAGAWADFGYVNNAVSVTDTSQTLTLGTTNDPVSTILVVNEGANPVYVRDFETGDTPAAATTSNGFKIASGESLTLTHSKTESGTGYIAISIVCGAGLTATARVLAK